MNIFTLILIVVAILFVVVVLFLLMKPGTSPRVQKKWHELRQSTTEMAEINNIKKLTELVASKNGYWEVVGITKDDEVVNMIQYEGALDDIQSVNVTFYWGAERYEGKGWTPLNKEHVYEFFNE